MQARTAKRLHDVFLLVSICISGPRRRLHFLLKAQEAKVLKEHELIDWFPNVNNAFALELLLFSLFIGASVSPLFRILDPYRLVKL